jgi:hypothetical protein
VALGPSSLRSRVVLQSESAAVWNTSESKELEIIFLKDFEPFWPKLRQRKSLQEHKLYINKYNTIGEHKNHNSLKPGSEIRVRHKTLAINPLLMFA